MERRARLWRSTAAALIATLTALAFHAEAGGAGSVLAVGVSFVLTLWVGVLLAGRRLGPLALGVVVVLAQILLHCTMTVFSAGPLVVRSMHSGSVLFSLGTADHGAHHAAPHLSGAAGGSLDAAMIAAHVAAAVVIVAFLRYGETMVLALHEGLLGPLALLFLSGGVPPVRRVRSIPRDPEVRAVTAAVVDSRFRRGPPLLLPA